MRHNFAILRYMVKIGENIDGFSGNFTVKGRTY